MSHPNQCQTLSIFVAIATFSIGTSGSTISSPLSWLPSNAKVHVDDEDILDGNFFLSFSKNVWRKWISKKILGVFSSSKSQWLCKKKENHLFYCLPLSLLNIKITSKPPLFFLASKCMVAWTSDINFRNLVTDAIWQSDLVTVPSLQITWNWRRELPISTFGLAMHWIPLQEILVVFDALEWREFSIQSAGYRGRMLPSALPIFNFDFFPPWINSSDFWFFNLHSFRARPRSAGAYW